MNISEDAMKIILENAAWDKFGIKVDGQQQITESAQEVSEEEEAHVCPLCSSHLDEAISDEELMEHTANILEAVNAATLNEEEEVDEEELVEEDESDDDDDDEEDYDDEDADDEEQVEEGKMPPQLKKAMMGKMGKKGKMPKK